MAKRGRPSNKTLQKRKLAKQKTRLCVEFAIIVLLIIIVIALNSL